MQKDRKGEIIKDTTTKDTEIIKLTQEPEKYFEAEVYPHVPDAIWAVSYTHLDVYKRQVVYSLDFEVTPHQLRHTYITNLIHSSVDPKTVQYLAGHESSKITMDIYAKVKYNRPDDLVKAMGCAFDLWDAV